MKRTKSVLVGVAVAATLGVLAAAAHAPGATFGLANLVPDTPVHDAAGAGATIADDSVNPLLQDDMSIASEAATTKLLVGHVAHDGGAYTGDTADIPSDDDAPLQLLADNVDVASGVMDFGGSSSTSPEQFQGQPPTLHWGRPNNLFGRGGGGGSTQTLPPLDVPPLLNDSTPPDSDLPPQTELPGTDGPSSSEPAGDPPPVNSSPDLPGSPTSPPPVNVPEPGTLALFGVALLGSGLVRRRQRQ